MFIWDEKRAKIVKIRHSENDLSTYSQKKKCFPMTVNLENVENTKEDGKNSNTVLSTGI